jgi:hypothetical protein
MSYDVHKKSPEWEAPVTIFMNVVDEGGYPLDDAVEVLDLLCRKFLTQGVVSELSSIQRHLRIRNSKLQIFALPFSEEEYPNKLCVNPDHTQSREYVPTIYPAECVAGYLSQLSMSHEVHETILARKTGVLIPKPLG